MRSSGVLCTYYSSFFTFIVAIEYKLNVTRVNKKTTKSGNEMIISSVFMDGTFDQFCTDTFA